MALVPYSLGPCGFQYSSYLCTLSAVCLVLSFDVLQLLLLLQGRWA
jgi:hypothetical protein